MENAVSDDIADVGGGLLRCLHGRQGVDVDASSLDMYRKPHMFENELQFYPLVVMPENRARFAMVCTLEISATEGDG